MATVVRDVYASCVSDSDLEHLIGVCLSAESCVGGASLRLDEGMEVTVPHQGVDPARYF